MIDNKIHVRPTLQLSLTAFDWGLDDNAEVDDIAGQLNRLVEHAVNTAPRREVASVAISTALLKFAEYGATKSEPRYTALQILKRCYP